MQPGQVEQANFDDFAPSRIAEMPKVEVRIVPSRESPTGVLAKNKYGRVLKILA